MKSAVCAFARSKTQYWISSCIRLTNTLLTRHAYSLLPSKRGVRTGMKLDRHCFSPTHHEHAATKPDHACSTLDLHGRAQEAVRVPSLLAYRRRVATYRDSEEDNTEALGFDAS